MHDDGSVGGNIDARSVADGGEEFGAEPVDCDDAGLVPDVGEQVPAAEIVSTCPEYSMAAGAMPALAALCSTMRPVVDPID